MVLLAGLVLALRRAGGGADLVIGTPVSVRDRAELDELIGYFINLVPLRFQLADGATAREVVHHVREVALGAYRHRGPDRTPCSTCPERLGEAPCRGWKEIVNAERAFRRLSGRWLGEAARLARLCRPGHDEQRFRRDARPA